MAEYNRYTNYKNNAGVSGVVYPAHSTVLEVELNEMQEISKNMLRDFIKNVAGNGITDVSKITYENGKIKIADGCAIAVDGILINCGGLELECDDCNVYLKVWEEVAAFNDTLKKYGNQQGETVDNWIKDDRSDVETTRRLVTKYTITSDENDISSTDHGLAIASIADGNMNVLVKEINISNLYDQVQSANGYVDLTDPDIFGVEVDWKNNKFTRLASAVGKTGGADYDGILPWDRKRCILADDGTVLAYHGDTAYTETGKLTSAVIIGETTYPIGTRAQVMVEQNKFYYRMIPLELEPIKNGIGFHLRKARYFISTCKKPGFKLFPVFERGRYVIDKLYDGAFKACVYDTSAGNYILNDSVTTDFNNDKMASIAGAKPMSGITNNLTRANSRKLANNVGAGWQQEDFLVECMTQWLFLIEYASFDDQTILGKGRCDITDDGSTSMTINTGGTSSLGNASGMASGTNGQVSVTYRGKEDPFGHIWEFVDGINIEAKGKNVAYWADENFADDTSGGSYKPCGFTLAMASGYVSAVGWSEDCDFAFLPTESLGDSSKTFCCYVWVNPTYDGWLIALLGGHWSNGLNCGLCCWALSNASSNRGRSIGSRLVYIRKSS